jgi:predicted NACHT family NTPase
MNRDQITTLQTVLRLGTRVVIVGEPGAGKTTVLQYLTLLFSRARISKFNRTTLRADPEELQKLLAARERLKRDYKFTRPPFPVPVFLSRLKSVTTWPESKSILDAVEEELAANDILRDIPAGFFRERLRQGDCIFLLDAFDELGAQQARDAIAARIGELGSASSSLETRSSSRVGWLATMGNSPDTGSIH